MSEQPGGNSDATGINSTGVAVGGFSTALGQAAHAFVWQDRIRNLRSEPGGLVNLRTLLPDEADWLVLFPRAINDRGQIVGFGERNDGQRGFLIHPR